MAWADDRVELLKTQRTAVIAGTARNCAKHLRRVLRKIDRIGAVFDRYAVVIVENDSKDETRAMLFDWAMTRPNVHIETEDNLLPDAFKTERIACCRNIALNVVRQNFADFHFLVWVDMDEPIKSLKIDEFVHALAYLSCRPNISGLFANSKPRYYDIWALRHPDWCPSDCWAQEAIARDRLWPNAATTMFVHSRQLAISPSQAPIEVDSAFNGLGIYRLAHALQSEYRGTTPDGIAVCEHVHFNEVLRSTGKRLVIFPAMRVSAPNQHLAPEAQSTLWKLESVARRQKRFRKQISTRIKQKFGLLPLSEPRTT